MEGWIVMEKLIGDIGVTLLLMGCTGIVVGAAGAMLAAWEFLCRCWRRSLLREVLVIWRAIL